MNVVNKNDEVCANAQTVKHNLYKKILYISTELNKLSLKKSGKNAFLKFDYFELDDFLPSVLRLCHEVGVLIAVDIEETRGVLTAYDVNSDETIVVKHDFHFQREILYKSLKMDPLQLEGCFSTYMRRYLISNLLGICEPDGLDCTMASIIDAMKKMIKGLAKMAKDGIQPTSIQLAKFTGLTAEQMQSVKEFIEKN